MKRFYLIFMLFGCLYMRAHPFYVSILEIHQNAQTGKLECAMKLFTDDLELAIQMNNGVTGLNLGSKSEHFKSDSVVWTFVEQHFEVAKGTVHFIGREGDVDSQWIYFEIEIDDNLSKTMIRWNSFIGLLPGQKNILHLHTGNKLKTYIFDKKNMHLHIPLEP